MAVAILVGATVGCSMSSAPESDLGFDRKASIESLAGCYRNRGDGEYVRYLSAVIWPGQQLEHAEIAAIKVELEGSRGLRVAAVTSGTTLKESVFQEGRDFHFESGMIGVKADTFTSLAYPAGNVFIGAGHEAHALGIDPRGDARMQENVSFAGTAFLVIPMAGSVRDAFRFPRSPELCEAR